VEARRVALSKEFERNLAFDLHNSWQTQALLATTGPARMIMLSVLAHTLERAVVTLCYEAFLDFDGSLPLPALVTAAKIDKTGAVVADVLDKAGAIHKDMVLFKNEIQMRDSFRKLADRMKLNDADRIEMFKYAQRWVVADRRLDPNFDPRDPDAKRLTVH
jgi:hypothetical protein